MFHRHRIYASLPVLLLLPALVPLLPAQPNKDKSVWNYDGGLFLETDGSLPSGPCFRLIGHAIAPEFFENLRREDSSLGTLYHRGHDIVTEFPAQLHVSFLMTDTPCTIQLREATTNKHLTRAAVSSLRLSFYWKHGVRMRGAEGVVPGRFETRRIPPYASELASELPEKLEWLFEFDVPSAGVPVTDSLVVVLRTPDGHIAARAAARM